MTELIDFQYGNIVGIKVNGDVSDKEFERISDFIKSKLNYFDTLRIYIEIVELSGMAPATFFKDLVFSLKHWNSFEKQAVVTNVKWIKKLTSVTDKLLPGINSKVFPLSKQEKARQWICE